MDFYPIKAQYYAGEEIKLRIESDPDSYDEAEIRIFSLEKMIEKMEIVIEKEVTDVAVEHIRSAGGYGAEIVLRGKKEDVYLETAFDIAEDMNASLRYGFLSDFGERDIDSEAVSWLRKLHINVIQYYDWSYRHDDLVSKEQQYTDMMGKKISMDTVRKKIREASAYGMRSVAYGAVYAASEEFYREHPKWAFYNGNQDAFCFIGTFYIMNIMKGSPWRHHLIRQYQEAIKAVGFDGIHMDTYGFPKTAYSHLGEEPVLISLERELPDLVNETRSEMETEGMSPLLIFNNVGNWPVESVARSRVDAVYIEVWQPYERYFHIKQLILDAKRFSKGEKPVILAAYLEPFRTEPKEKAAPAAYLLTAAIVSNGAYHLLLGEKDAVLTQGYYSDYSTMSPETSAVMRQYYDFMIRYMDLFYDPTLRDVSMTHIGWDNYEYKCCSDNWSVYGEKDKVWLTIRENRNIKTISLVNLCGCEDDYWNRGKGYPVSQKNVSFVVQVDEKVKGIYFATPDRGSTECEELPYQYLENDKGRFIRFTVPEIRVWALVYIKIGGTL